MNIVIIGYGKMGKEIEKICLTKNYQVLLKINSKNTQLLKKNILKNCDVAIDFSESKSVLKNILFLLENEIPVVSGTTGWDKEINIAKKKCIEKKGSFLYSPNFSIGMNIFFELNKFLAKKMLGQKTYKSSITEKHHKEKKDKPSGTAIKLANDIIKEVKYLKNWSLQSKNEASIPIKSYREGEKKGIHTINYKSYIDEISISHKAVSREGFAMGAIIAAEFIKNKKGIFTMKNVIKTQS